MSTSNFDLTDEDARASYTLSSRSSSSMVSTCTRDRHAELRAKTNPAEQGERAADLGCAFTHRLQSEVTGSGRRGVKPVAVVGDHQHQLCSVTLEHNVDAAST